MTPRMVRTVAELRALDPERFPFYAGGPHMFAYATANVRACDDRILAHRLPATILAPAIDPPADVREALASIRHEGCTCPRIHPHHFAAILALLPSLGYVRIDPDDEALVEKVARAIHDDRCGCGGSPWADDFDAARLALKAVTQ